MMKRLFFTFFRGFLYCKETHPVKISASGVLFLMFFFCAGFSSEACTVFVLTDGKRTHFFNNEDFTDPKTRLWFIPKGKRHFGCAYVGFNNGEPQGGVNTEGLAFDWVTVDSDSYETDPAYIPAKHLKRLDGNSSQWMSERCKTVEEAIKFYQTYREPAFARTTLIIADKSGASVIIGSRNGTIYFDISKKSRGMGYGEGTFKKLYNSKSSTDVNEGAEILRQCVATGDGGTKYSNSYDLTTGDIVFYQFGNKNLNTKLNLFAELEKGGHYYEPSQIAIQIKQPLRPLMLNMNRHILFNYKPLTGQEPEITAKIKKMFSKVSSGKLIYDDFSENLMKGVKNEEANMKSMFEKFGSLKSLELIHKKKLPEHVDYSYIMKFEKVTILWQFIIDDKRKIQDFNTLNVAWNASF